MADRLLTPEEIVPYLKTKYPHLYQGNDESWCRIQEDALLSLLKRYDVELLLDAQAKLTAEIVRAEGTMIAHAELTLLVAEIQACDNMYRVKEILESWITANDLHPELVETYDSIESLLEALKEGKGVE